MKKNIGIIDLGSNTFHLLIATVDEAGTTILLKKRYYVFLAQTGVKRIAPEAIERGMKALSEFQTILEKYNVTEVIAIGTAALRKASNANDFIEAVFQKFNLSIQTIDGHREANLIYKGITLACPIASEHALMMDIGGGSIEFTLTQDGTIVYQESISIGLGILNDTIPLSDPINFQQINQIRNCLDSFGKKLLRQIKTHKPHSLIGAAGSFEVISEALNDKDEMEEKCSTVSIERVYQFIRPLIFSTAKERMNNDFIPQKRVNLAVYAFVVIEWILDRGNFEKIYFSKYSLKEGALKEYYDLWIGELKNAK